MSRVIVAGSINMDIVARTKRFPKPGETVLGTEVRLVPGGKGANQAIASSKLGTDTVLLGAVGADSYGKELCSFLEHAGVNTCLVKRVHNAASGTAVIVVNETGENTIVVIPGANSMLTESDVLLDSIAQGNILVAQFEIPLSTTLAFFKHGKSQGTINILNPSPSQKIPDDLLALSDVVVLNATELNQQTGSVVSPDTAADCCRRFQAFKEQIVVLTLGKDGVVAIHQKGIVRELGHSVSAIDSTGAGDCFVGALASRLACGDPLEQAVAFANSAAAVSVQRFGAGPSMPTWQEVHDFIQS